MAEGGPPEPLGSPHEESPPVAAVAVSLALAVLAPAASAASTAPAQVFAPNPVADLGIQSLTDQKDADYFSADPLLKNAYHRVTLTDLDGSGTLTGAYAKVLSETGKAATGTSFIFTRDQDQFEQVMGYYWVTRAQLYIQSLGFGSTLPAVNKRQQLLRINQFGGDNSFYREGTASSRSRSARVASTTPRTPRSSFTSTATRSRTTRCPASARRPTRARSARASATTSPSPSGSP